ncbi:MAG: chemotaxis protein CheW, partial [Pseudomonadota bacterium]
MMTPVDALARNQGLREVQLASIGTEFAARRTRLWHGVRVGRMGFLLPQTTSSEVVEPLSICDIPRSPGYLHGVINVRGNLVPVFDLARALAINHPPASRPRYLVVNFEEDSIAILVSELPTSVPLEDSDRLGNLPVPGPA